MWENEWCVFYPLPFLSLPPPLPLPPFLRNGRIKPGRKKRRRRRQVLGNHVIIRDGGGGGGGLSAGWAYVISFVY